jgi:hypothetical protein
LACIKVDSVTLYFFARLSRVSPGCIMMVSQPAGGGHCGVGKDVSVGEAVTSGKMVDVRVSVVARSVVGVLVTVAGVRSPGSETGGCVSLWTGAGNNATRCAPSVSAREKLPSTRLADTKAARMPKLIWRRSFIPTDLLGLVILKHCW